MGPGTLPCRDTVLPGSLTPQGPWKESILGGPLLGTWLSRWGAVRNLWLCHLAWQRGLCSGGSVRDPEAAGSSGIIWVGPVSPHGSLSEESRGVGAREGEVGVSWPGARECCQPPEAGVKGRSLRLALPGGTQPGTWDSAARTAATNTCCLKPLRSWPFVTAAVGHSTHVASHTERSHVPASPLAGSSGCKGNRPVKVIASVGRRMTPDDATSPTLGFGVQMPPTKPPSAHCRWRHVVLHSPSGTVPRPETSHFPSATVSTHFTLILTRKYPSPPHPLPVSPPMRPGFGPGNKK